MDYTELEHKLGSTCGDDAMKWAEAFCQHHQKHNFTIDESLMVGWFANAIEVAHDVRMERLDQAAE